MEKNSHALLRPVALNAGRVEMEKRRELLALARARLGGQRGDPGGGDLTEKNFLPPHPHEVAKENLVLLRSRYAQLHEWLYVFRDF